MVLLCSQGHRGGWTAELALSALLCTAEDRSKEQLQSNQSGSGVVPCSIKGGEKQVAELNVQKNLRWKGGGLVPLQG